MDNYALEGRTLQIGANPALPEASLDRLHICGWSRMDKNMPWKVSIFVSKTFSRYWVVRCTLKINKRLIEANK
jgi:hypothetical protein